MWEEYMETSNKNKNKADQNKSQAMTIVGIGASAGGLNALKLFFEKIPENTGIAYVIVVHLSPEHKSMLSELLQPVTKMPVQQVTKTIQLKPNHVYVIPPGSNLNTIDTHLRLSELEEKRSKRAPVDHFFRTLAKTHDGNAIGIVLTGTGSDGSLGIREIKGRDGVVIVQDPNEAEYDGMPQSAISTGMVDLVLPLSKIADHVIRISKVNMQLPVLETDKELNHEEKQLLQKIFAQVRARTGRDFRGYKVSTVMRRLHRRMQLFQITEIKDYLELLRKNSDEVKALSDDFLITVTNFFRDPEVFKYLETEVIPALFKDKDPEDQVRVWSVGCATGEEAYSLVIQLLEEANRHSAPPGIQVFASDLHQRSLKKAREGYFTGDIEVDVSSERLKKFFIREDGGYRVRKEVREQVIFTPHNIMGDPPFSKLDMIVCRNLLIYLKREIQPDIIELFHYALNPDGVLVLGTSEHLDSSELFRPEHKDYSLYIKLNVIPPEPKLPVFPFSKPKIEIEDADENQHEPVSFGIFHQRMVEKYAPPSILISPEYKILHVSENAGRYLVYPGGEPTQNLFKIARDELKAELRNLIFKAKEKKEFIRSKPVRMKIEGELKQVILSARIAEEPKQEKFILIIFEEYEPSLSTEGTDKIKDKSKEVYNQELEGELEVMQQRFQSLSEEYETSQEEMKASNEELQSANEELRSTMEELETSKEELQSINEELSTVNQENKHKVEELSQLSDDLQNLLAATDIATLFLNRDLRILRFTPKLGELFNVRPADRGRPITDLTHKLGYEELVDDAKQVLKNLTPVEREVRDEENKWYLTRVLPYRSTEDQIKGIVITFIDITSRKNAENSLRESEEHLQLILDNAKDYAIFTLDTDLNVNSWNSGAENILGYSKEEIIGKSGDIVFVPEDREIEAKEEIRKALEDGKAENERWHLRKDGSRFWGSGYMMTLQDNNGENRGFLKIMRDQTEQQLAAEKIRESERQLKDQKDRMEFSLEAGKIGIWEWDFINDVSVWSERKKEIFGLDPKNIKNPIENGKEFFKKFIHPEDQKYVIKSLEETGKNKDRIHQAEFRIIKPDGYISWISERGEIQYNEQEEPVKMFGTTIDITKRKFLEQQKDDFLGIASHELKTPVAVMKGYVNMVEQQLKGNGNKKESELLRKVDDQIKRISSIINDLLDVTRIESGRIKYEMEEFDFDQLVDETVESMQYLSTHNLIRTGKSGKKVVADKERTGQVIVNFIANAIKYSPKERDVIINTSSNDNDVILKVQDFGMGIPKDSVNKVFDRFYRIRNTTGNKSSGMGLGLFISAEIINRQNGKIWVESQEGKGSEFSFSLPAK